MITDASERRIELNLIELNGPIQANDAANPCMLEK